VTIILMDISGYSIVGYFIDDYFINDYCWLFYE
jgi:hypothetical protein